MSDAENRFDPQQAAALSVANASVGLSAGAGCGKTHVLTERFLRLLDGDTPLSLPQIVALTFTDKAARELRDRVRRECRNRLASLGDPGRVEHWRDVLRSLEIARIGTFHAFCGQLLKRFSSEAGIDPSFAVMEEVVAPSVRQTALDACCRKGLAERDEDLIELAADLGLTALRKTLSQLLASVDPTELAPWLAKEPEAILGEWLALRDSVIIPRLVQALVDSGTPTIDLLIANPPSNPAMVPRRLALMDEFPRLGTTPEVEKSLQRIVENARIQGTQPKHLADPSVYEPLRDGLTEIRDQGKVILDTLAFDRQGTLVAIARGQRLGRLLMKTGEMYADLKRRDSRLDFADLQRKTRSLLRDHPDVVARLVDEIEMLLIDEFQDTDPIQAEIIRSLGGPSRADGRLFLVGDRKQSIYRFRGAQPALFQEMRDEFPEAGRRVLGRNYRSVPGVIHFVNALFADTFPGGEHALEPSREAVSPTPAVEFVWPNDPDQPDPSAGERRRIEAQWLARLIAQRLKDGWTIWDSRTKSPRDATAGDVVFLFRTLNDSAEYESALEGVGLDYYLSGGAAFYARQEVLDVINLLSLVEDPSDPLALAATLRGPFGCVSDDGLYWLARSLDGGLCAGFDAWERLPQLPINDRRRIERFHAFIRRLRGWKDRMPIAELLDRALDESGFEAAVLAEPMGRRKRANVRKLVERARQFDVESGLTLADFVARLKADLHDPPREAEAATTDEDSDAIQFMTIHASKGKEFPIVVLPDLNKDRANRAVTAMFRPDLGLLVRFKDDSEGEAGQDLGMVLERHFETVEEEEEALRLLYVATTRAKDVLILSAGGSPSDKPRSPAMELLARRFDRADGTCLDSRYDGPVPPIRITVERPELHTEPLPQRRRRPRYLAVASAIERASASGDAPRGKLAERPSLLDFDAATAASPFSHTRFRLFRTVLRRLDDFDLLGVESQVERAARASGMMVAQAVRDDVARWVVSFLKTEPGRILASGSSFRPFVPWSLAWPPDHSRPTVFTGTADLVLYDGDHLIGLVVVDPAATTAASLRLALSERALVDSPGKVGLGRWIVRVGETVDARKVPPSSGNAIEQLMDRLFQEEQD